MKLINKIFVLLFILVVFSGCAKQVKYKDVYIPVKCDVKDRVKPKNNGDPLVYLKELLIYTEGLERDLAYCKGANNGK